jgi:hypothetical protein
MPRHGRAGITARARSHEQSEPFLRASLLMANCSHTPTERIAAEPRTAADRHSAVTRPSASTTPEHQNPVPFGRPPCVSRTAEPSTTTLTRTYRYRSFETRLSDLAQPHRTGRDLGCKSRARVICIPPPSQAKSISRPLENLQGLSSTSAPSALAPSPNQYHGLPGREPNVRAPGGGRPCPLCHLHLHPL